MRNDDFTTELSELESDYQILTELHHTADSRTYLARHLGLNRDVSITVIRDAAADSSRLDSFHADVERLKTARHPNVIPVIEGRRLSGGAYAVVRARVRGSSLDQLVAAEGALPLPRVADGLSQVQSALDWARENGIRHRHVAQDAMIFQQGSGRVLLALDPFPQAIGSAAERCDDLRTLGALAWEMLSGRRIAAAATTSLASVRPDLSPRIVAETEALMHCARGDSRDVAAYIALLSAAGWFTSRSAVAAPVVEPVVAAPVVAQRGMSFNRRMMTAVAVAAVLAIVAFFITQRGNSSAMRLASNTQSSPAGEASGDVALRSTTDTAVRPSAPYFNYDTAVTTGATGATTPMPATQPMQPMQPMPTPASPIAPPVTRRSEPPAPTLTMPPAGVPPLDTAAPPPVPMAPARKPTPVVTDVCASTASADQHTCLMNAVEKNDVVLNSVYQTLLAALSRNAPEPVPNDPIPSAADRLRTAQRRWVDERDAACRNVGDGALYARERATCFADQSATRVRELREMLSAVPRF